MLLLQFYDLNLFQNKTLWLKNRKEISFPSLSLICLSLSLEGQEERKQSGELFSDDWGRTVNLRPSDSDGSKCYSCC